MTRSRCEECAASDVKDLAEASSNGDEAIRNTRYATEIPISNRQPKTLGSSNSQAFTLSLNTQLATPQPAIKNQEL